MLLILLSCTSGRALTLIGSLLELVTNIWPRRSDGGPFNTISSSPTCNFSCSILAVTVSIMHDLFVSACKTSGERIAGLILPVVIREWPCIRLTAVVFTSFFGIWYIWLGNYLAFPAHANGKKFNAHHFKAYLLVIGDSN